MYEKFQDVFRNCVEYGDAGQCELVYGIDTADVSIITYIKVKSNKKYRRKIINNYN